MSDGWPGLKSGEGRVPQVRFLNLGLTSIFLPITARRKHGTTGRFLFRLFSTRQIVYFMVGCLWPLGHRTCCGESLMCAQRL